MDGVLGSDYRFYWLAMASILKNDFIFEGAYDGSGDKPIKGTRKQGSRSPFSSAYFSVQGIKGIYVLEKIEWQREGLPDIQQIFEEYDEVENAPGYLAPSRVNAGNTQLLFTRWSALEPLDWLLSTNHSLIEIQRLPWLGRDE
jgi:hypothetical protein